MPSIALLTDTIFVIINDDHFDYYYFDALTWRFTLLFIYSKLHWRCVYHCTRHGWLSTHLANPFITQRLCLLVASRCYVSRNPEFWWTATVTVPLQPQSPQLHADTDQDHHHQLRLWRKGYAASSSVCLFLYKFQSSFLLFCACSHFVFFSFVVAAIAVVGCLYFCLSVYAAVLHVVYWFAKMKKRVYWLLPVRRLLRLANAKYLNKFQFLFSSLNGWLAGRLW